MDITAIVVFLILLAVIAVILNSLCIHIIHGTRKLNEKPSSLLVVNLLTVHLVQGLFVFPFYAGKKLKVSNLFWARLFANGFRFTYMLTFYGTCLGVLCISIDRFLATYWLQNYKSRVTKKRVSIALLSLWFYIVALCLIPFIPEQQSDLNQVSIYTNQTVQVGVNSTSPTDSTSSRPKFYYYNQQNEWVVFMLTFNTAIPYGLIILSYIYIISRLKKMETKKNRDRAPSGIALENRLDRGRAPSSGMVILIDNQGKELKLRRKDVEKYKQVTWLTLVLAITYGIFWTPSIIYYPLLSMCKSCFAEDYDDSSLEQHIGFITKYLGFMDSMAAPLIYCAYHSEFRNSLMRIRSKILRQPLAVPDQTHGESTELL